MSRKNGETWGIPFNPYTFLLLALSFALFSLSPIQPPHRLMALVAHVFRLDVLVQGIFRNLRALLEMEPPVATMRQMTAHAGHFIARKRISLAFHRMLGKRVSQAVVAGQRNCRQVG